MSVKRLYLDFGSNTEINEERNKDWIYKVGLKDQFEKLSSELSYEDFVTKYVAKSNVEIGISYPNFERKEPSEERNLWYNIAVRMSVDHMLHDIVMMCDIHEYRPGNNPIHRMLRVKGFTLLDKGTNACGEILEVCDVFTRLVFADVWYNENFEPIKFLSDRDISLSILSIPFLERLNEKYVAEPHQRVINRLDKWRKYLDAKNEVISKDSGVGYSIDDGPELLMGYFKSGCTESEKIKAIKHLVIKGTKDVWSSEELPGSQKAPLLRIAHDFLKKDYNQNDELRRKFERFTNDRSLIMSEKYRENEDKHSMSNFPSSIRLSESKISSKAYEEEIINDVKIDKITKAKDDRISLLRKNTDKDFKKEIDILLEHYSSSKLQEELEEYREKQYNLAKEEALGKQNRLISEEEKIIEQDIDKTRKTIEKEKAELSDITEKRERCLEKLESLRVSLKKASAKLISSSDKEKVNASRALKEIRDSVGAKESEFKTLEKNIDDKTHSIENHEESILILEEDREKLSEKHSLDNIIQNLISPLIQKYRNELIEERKKLLKNQLRPKYDQILADKINDAQDEANAAVEKVLAEETRIRLHVYYRLDVDNNTDSETILKNTGDNIGGKSMYLYKDFSGDRAILWRQTTALNNLRNGSVMNPFLATALFNSASQKSRRVEGNTDFYSKRLNKKQEEAVEKAISSNGLFLIRGPPGTGKTEVIAEITAQLVTGGKKVLIASENHKAVDNAFTRLPELPILRRVRLFGGYPSKREEKNQYSVRSLTRNFYSDIAKCLEDEVKKASNSQEYAGRLDEIICELK